MQIGLMVLGSLAVGLTMGLMVLCAGARLLTNRESATQQLLIAPRGAGYGVARNMVQTARYQQELLAPPTDRTAPGAQPSPGRQRLVVLTTEHEQTVPRAA